MGKLVVAVALGVVALVLGLASLMAASGAGLLSSTSGVAPSTEALADIPAAYLQAFEAAASTCPGLPWTVLAGIGRVETDFGADDQVSSAGAEGPMQFLPSTWAEWGIDAFGHTGTPDIDNPLDAVPAAARMLCADGGGSSSTLSSAIFYYNHATWYVDEVLALASEYAQNDS